MRRFFKLFTTLFVLFLLQGSVAFPQLPGNWWNDAVFYEVFVRSFYDSNGDGIGDIRGLINKLDYLNDGDSTTTSDLGITGIWLMPINPSPSYHGYDVTDYRGINQKYGTMNDFKELVAKAHQRGIKIIIDFVMNHSSSQHPWFASSVNPNSPYRNYYTWMNSNPGYTGSWGQTVWHRYNSYYYLGQFSSGMPDLNYTYEPVKNEMFANVQYWLDSVGIDGFRLDAVKHLFEDGRIMEHAPATFTFLQEFRTFYKGVNPNAVTVGEVWSPTSQVVPYCNGDKLDLCFEFDLAGAIISAVKNSAPAGLANKMASVVSQYQALQYATFLTNHDQDRVYGLLNQNEKWMKLAASVYLTLPGVPFLYYGEEIGMNGFGDDRNKRRPMAWTPGTNGGFTTGTPWYGLGTPYANNNVQVMSADPGSLLSRYRRLIHLRNSELALRRGGYRAGSSSNSSVYAFGRDLRNEAIFVIHNFSDFPAANFTVSMNQSNLAMGTYYLVNAETGASLGEVSVNYQGGFTDLQLATELGGKESLILKIQNTPAGVSDENTIPGTFTLYPNYPNPFNPATTVSFSLPSRAQVEVAVYNLHGECVQVLHSGVTEPGYYAMQFSAENLPSGVYFIRAISGSVQQTVKAILLK